MNHQLAANLAKQPALRLSSSQLSVLQMSAHTSGKEVILLTELARLEVIRLTWNPTTAQSKISSTSHANQQLAKLATTVLCLHIRLHRQFANCYITLKAVPSIVSLGNISVIRARIMKGAKIQYEH
jgi:hypothetical protein